jgi:hypothetical protein
VVVARINTCNTNRYTCFTTKQQKNGIYYPTGSFVNKNGKGKDRRTRLASREKRKVLSISNHSTALNIEQHDKL